MKRTLSLKLFVSLAFLTLAILIVITYSFLSAHFFVRGMDNIVAENFEHTAIVYNKRVPKSRRKAIDSFHGYSIGNDWQQFPTEIKQAFKQAPEESSVLYKFDGSSWFQRPNLIHFVMKLQLDDGSLFISKTISPKTASPLIGKNAKESMRLLLMISISIALAMGLFIWLLLKRIAQPVSQLRQWTHQLDISSLAEPTPDFAYPELNDMAALIRNSLSSVQQSLEREDRFLAYASHELRTPISVIRNNIELINKLKQNSANLDVAQLNPIINRIDRASLTMKHLSETLLWLSRDISESLPKQEIDLESLIKELNNEMAYLLDNKTIELYVSTEAHQMTLAEYPARIILGNLIRNAFQHTMQGQISIQQQKNTVIISNQEIASDNEHQPQDLGFGLGIQLSAQLADKLGWSYQKSHYDGLYRVEVSF